GEQRLLIWFGAVETEIIGAPSEASFIGQTGADRAYPTQRQPRGVLGQGSGEILIRRPNEIRALEARQGDAAHQTLLTVLPQAIYPGQRKIAIERVRLGEPRIARRGVLIEQPARDAVCRDRPDESGRGKEKRLRVFAAAEPQIL